MLYLDKLKYAELHGDIHFFGFGANIWANLIQKIKIVSLS